MKWMLKNNDNEEIFDDFNKATVAFKNDICDHMRKNQSIYDIYNLPEDVCCHFAYKYDEGTISDDDLIAFCRAPRPGNADSTASRSAANASSL